MLVNRPKPRELLCQDMLVTHAYSYTAAVNALCPQKRIHCQHRPGHNVLMLHNGLTLSLPLSRNAFTVASYMSVYPDTLSLNPCKEHVSFARSYFQVQNTQKFDMNLRRKEHHKDHPAPAMSMLQRVGSTRHLNRG